MLALDRGLAAAAAAAMKAERLARLQGLEMSWAEGAVVELATVIDMLPADAEFTIERVREFCTPMPQGSDKRAWGFVTQRALKLGVIERTGKYQSVESSNGALKPLYRRGHLATT